MWVGGDSEGSEGHNPFRGHKECQAPITNSFIDIIFALICIFLFESMRIGIHIILCHCPSIFVGAISKEKDNPQRRTPTSASFFPLPSSLPVPPISISQATLPPFSQLAFEIWFRV